MRTYIVGVLFEELLAAAGGRIAGELATDLGNSVDGYGEEEWLDIRDSVRQGWFRSW